MPNGHHGSKEEWERMEAPLVELDPLIESFAKSRNLTVSRNYHSWPERSLTINDEIHRQVQVWLRDEKQMTFKIVAVAWQDRGLKRYLKDEVIAEDKTAEGLRKNLLGWLEEGYKTVITWTPSDMKFVTHIQKLP